MLVLVPTVKNKYYINLFNPQSYKSVFRNQLTLSLPFCLVMNPVLCYVLLKFVLQFTCNWGDFRICLTM